MSRGLNVLLWITQALVALGFLYAGAIKLTGDPMMVENFDLIGWGQWFRYVTGVIEITGGLLVLFPRKAPLGAALLFCTMIGAIIAHLTVLGMGGFAAPPILAAMCAFIIWGRRRTHGGTTSVSS